MTLTPRPTPLPSGEYRTPTFPGGKILWMVIVLGGIMVLAIAMPGEILSGDNKELMSSVLYYLNPPDLPPIALNPPNETARQQLADTLIKQGYEPEEIGEIEEYYSKESVPKAIPISEAVMIRDLRIVGNDTVKFTVENVAGEEIDTPFYKISGKMFVKHPTFGTPIELEIGQLAHVKIGEEKMQPGEKREIVVENILGKLDADLKKIEGGSYEKYYNISEVIIIYEEFYR